VFKLWPELLKSLLIWNGYLYAFEKFMTDKRKKAKSTQIKKLGKRFARVVPNQGQKKQLKKRKISYTEKKVSGIKKGPLTKSAFMKIVPNHKSKLRQISNAKAAKNSSTFKLFQVQNVRKGTAKLRQIKTGEKILKIQTFKFPYSFSGFFGKTEKI